MISVELLPFGESVGDKMLPPAQSIFTRVSTSTPQTFHNTTFPFFGTQQNTIFVSFLGAELPVLSIMTCVVCLRGSVLTVHISLALANLHPPPTF